MGIKFTDELIIGGGDWELAPFRFSKILMDYVSNNTRSSQPIKKFIDLESLIEYIRVMLDVKTEKFDGVEYLRAWLKTLPKAVKEGK